MKNISIRRLMLLGSYLAVTGMSVSLLQAEETGFVRARGKPGDAGVRLVIDAAWRAISA